MLNLVGVGTIFRRAISGAIDAITAAVNAFYTTYIARVTTDSGSARSETNTKAIYRWFVENNLVSYIKFLWFAEAGIKIANPSDTLKRLSKGYSLDSTPNDWTQTVEANQPYLSGNIAPTEKYAVKNVSGSARRGDFTAITFTSGQAWTATFVGQWDGSNNAEAAFLGKANDAASLISFRNSSVNRFRIINESAASVAGSETINHLIGKNIIVSFVATGTGSLKIYVNGTLLETLTVATNISLSRFLGGFNTASREFFGRCHYIDITQYDFTSLISSYHTLLRTIYPEIETVQIGTQHWATSNYDAVVTPMGTVIPNVTDAGAWKALSTPAWCYYNNNPATGATYGKLYNGYAIRQIKQDIDAWNAANPTNPWGYHVPDGSEVTTLLNGLGSESDKYKHIKHSALWGIAGTNSTGFTLIPHGARAGVNGSFSGIGIRATLLSNTAYHTFYDDNSNYYTGSWDGKLGAALRLLKD